ncbi:MAG TPA: tripartite tricarboxylate transporter substrate binding protein [Roseomonas sp.]|jgi:tripartite-type tricarboxylate transporter receptor subunit TctC
MMFHRRGLFGLAGTAVLARSTHAQAPDYPTRPVRIIVGFPPGGASDILGRAVAQELTKALAQPGHTSGQPFVVENRGGANSLIATQELIRAAPDGHTLMMTHASYVTNALFYPGHPYDPARDATGIATVARSPFVLLANPSLGARSMAELIRMAKAKPGGINYASPGMGSMQHLSHALLDSQADIRLTHVPYNGGGPALNDLIAGHVSLMFSTTVQAAPFIQGGQLIPIAVSSARRLPILPEVPAIAETVPGFESDLWHGIIGPKGIPERTVARLNEVVGRIVGSPEMRARLAAQGTEPFLTTPAEFAALLASETEKWARVLREAGVSANPT